MVDPSVRNLPDELKRVAQVVAKGIAAAGHRAWIVGGAVRDLVLEREVHDVDVVSAARPEEIERAFERTVPVGKAFGTVVVPIDGFEVQVATFRSESGYSDRRRPDQVSFGASLEQDARRRDFTCNALYLDPLEDELRDPARGLEDLSAGVLRTVGDARARFREDGLRLLRLARFEATLGLKPAQGLHEAALAEAGALTGVSVERVLAELTRLFEAPGSGRALAVLAECELLGRVLPGGAPAGEALERRLAVHARLPEPPGAPLALACWLEDEPSGTARGTETTRPAELRARALELRPSRELLGELTSLWDLRRRIVDLARGEHPRSEQIRAMREACWPAALHLARAWQPELGSELEGLERLRAGLTEAQLRPAPWITSDDLARAGVARGRTWGELLLEAETRQLDGAFADRAAALEWLRGKA